MKVARQREQIRRYFSAGMEEIAARNRYMLRHMARLYLVCLIVHLLFVCLPQGIAAQTWAVAAATAVHAVFMMTVWEKMDNASPRTIERIIVFFGIEILMLTGWVGIVVFREMPAFLFPLMIVLMSQIYTMRPKVTLSIVGVSAGAFIIASGITKQPEIFILDTMSCIIAAAISMVSYFASLQYKTDMFDLEQNLRHMCSVDGMTGVLNKTTFEYYVSDFLKKRSGNRTFALAVVDLDHFKTINDSYGHKAGDDSLLAVSSILRDTFSSEDSHCVGRFGGDEFVIMLKEAVSVKETEKVFGELMEKIGSCGNFAVKVTCSIGVAVSNRADVTFSQLFLAADRALYAAKEQGGNSFSVTEIDRNIGAAPLMLVTDGTENDKAVLRARFAKEFRLIETSGGRETLDTVQRYRDGLSLILVCLDMPEMSGRDVIRQIRKLPEMRAVPIIAIVGTDGASKGLDVQGEVKAPIDAAAAAECVTDALREKKS
ncbi:MAG: diguanylate cyclase [Oscillospiraceae bacterium]|nr:diguanylate cyclase [Oscillospiraceae bacterium]